ncbi:PPOX class F420-dependent oxidoreductase [Nakamurella silvestris]|nr:PPOX class F420-dependent oxidoreductase [Nakamurella silvestris]
MDLDPKLEGLLAGTHNGVLATIKRDGLPQLSNITYGYDRDTRTAQISVTQTRAKTRNLRRDPRATLYVPGADFWTFTVAEARAELTDPATDVNDATVEALVGYYRSIRGEHPDWAEYRQVMVDESRVLLTLRVDRLYGQ